MRSKPINFDRKKPKIFVQISVTDKNRRRDQNVHRLIAERGSEICDRFSKRNISFFVIPTEKDLQKNKDKSDRSNKSVNIGFLHVFGKNIAQKRKNFNCCVLMTAKIINIVFLNKAEKHGITVQGD